MTNREATTTMPGETDADRALEAARKQIRALYDKSPLPIYVWRWTGADFLLADYNDASVRATRSGIHDLLGITAREMFADRPEIVAMMSDCLERQAGVETETAYRMRTTGEERRLAVTAVYMPPDQVLVHTEDLTPRWQAERELRRNRDLLLALSQAAGAMHQAPTTEQAIRAIYDEIGKLGYHALVLALSEDRRSMTLAHLSWRPAVLRAVERLAKRRSADTRIPLAPDGFFQPLITDGKSLFCERTADLAMRGLPELGRAVLGRAVDVLGLSRTIYAPVRKGGELCGILCVGGADLTEAFVPAITAFANQISIAMENLRLREQLEASRRELGQLARQVMTTQEDERRRIAVILHDEVGQVLTRLRLGLDLIGESLPDGSELERQRVREAADDVSSIGEVVRSLARGLRPPLLDLVGLGVALREVCRSFQSSTGMSIRYAGPDDAQAPDDVSITLYRVLQEGLTNVAKHAQASRVRVDLTQDKDLYYLTIRDNGKGFGPVFLPDKSAEKAWEHIPPHGLGLLAIQERLKDLGGDLEIRSEPGQGTVLVAIAPRSGSARG